MRSLQSLRGAGAPGHRWLEELKTSRDPWFNINVGDGFYHYHRAGTTICRCRSRRCPGYMRAACTPGESLDRPVEKLREERTQLIADYRELLDTDEERAAYDQMIALAHRVFPYVEGHKFYCEHWYTNLFFNKIREFGALLAKHGFFASAEDVFHLTHYELEAAIIDLMNSWSAGSAAARPGLLAADRRRTRRAAIAEWAKHETPPALGPMPDVIDDPGDRDAVGHHAREPRYLALGGRRARTATRCAASPLRAAWSKARRAS